MSTLIERLKKAKTKSVPIPDSDEKVLVRKLSAREFDAYGKAINQEGADHVGLLVGLIIKGVQNEDGSPAWSDDDADALRDLPLSTLKALAEAIAAHSGIDPDSKKG